MGDRKLKPVAANSSTRENKATKPTPNKERADRPITLEALREAGFEILPDDGTGYVILEAAGQVRKHPGLENAQ